MTDRARLGKLFGALGDPSAREAALTAIDASIASCGGWGSIAHAIASADEDAPARQKLFDRLLSARVSECLQGAWALSAAEAALVASVHETLAHEGGAIAVADMVAMIDLADTLRRRTAARR